MTDNGILCITSANTPENRSAVDRKIAQLESDWQSLATTTPSPALLWGAQLLTNDEPLGLDASLVHKAAAILVLRELRRRWADELTWSEAADDLRGRPPGSEVTIDV